MLRTWRHFGLDGSTFHSSEHGIKLRRGPEPFLSLGLCSAAWLKHALPILVAAMDAAELNGEELVHFDVRSDNICFVGNRVVLVDWNWAAVANGDADLALWLPSLQAQGGPRPEDILPNAPELAAFVSGLFASWAGLPAQSSASPKPHQVRELQLQQLRTALPWAVRSLGLPPLDGPHALGP